MAAKETGKTATGSVFTIRQLALAPSSAAAAHGTTRTTGTTSSHKRFLSPSRIAGPSRWDTALPATETGSRSEAARRAFGILSKTTSLGVTRRAGFMPTTLQVATLGTTTR